MAKRAKQAAKRPRAAKPRGLCVVGIGASAGGFNAISELLGAVPRESGLAFVVLQHLSPSQKSLSAELFARRTALQVEQARSGTPLRADRVYTIPPGVHPACKGGALRFERPEPGGRRLPIDHFFRTLGEDCAERAIGVVLSGTGTDGTLGLKHVVAHGGIVLAQSPESAEFDGMPRSAIGTGLVSHVLAPRDMPAVILAYARHPYATRARESARAAEAESAALRVIIDVMRANRGFNLEGYRQGALLRRVQRRMGLHRIGRMAEYAALLRRDAGELEALQKDMMICVTEFFRDPAAWKALEADAIRPLVAAKREGEPIRAWVPGVATGEEAYSLAILILEALRRAHKTCPVQIFATDSNEEAVEYGRHGVYPAGIAAHVPRARLERYFRPDRDGHHYRVDRELRGRVVFAVQNVMSDPPFSRVDLVSCRNLLIYLEPEAQQRLLQAFHYALRPGGILFLGAAETVTRLERLFKPVARKWRIFRQAGGARPAHLDWFAPAKWRAPPVPAAGGAQRAPRRSVAALAQELILERFAPASVVVNGSREVLYYTGPTERFLRQPRGAPSVDVLALARDGLRGPLREALERAMKSDTRAPVQAIVRRDRGLAPVRIVVQAIPEDAGEPPRFLVVLQEAPRPGKGSGREARPPRGVVRDLESELRATRDELERITERYQNSAEEQKAATEEVVSANEELQSMNEELESSKEELQSLNEELSTLNQQLQTKLAELEGANNDLRNLIDSTDVATLCLDRELRIKWFTPAALGVLSAIAGDVGRPIKDLGTPLAGESLQQDARAVLESLVPLEAEVKGADGRAWLRRTLPYRTAEDRIQGVIVNYADITETRRMADRALAAEQRTSRTLGDKVDLGVVQLRRLAAELTLAEERERAAIARDLHDNLAQLLHAIRLKLAGVARASGGEDAAARLRELDELTRRAEGGARSLVFKLVPPVLSELGLVPALHWLGEEMQRTHGLAVEVREDAAAKPLGQDTRAVVYRAVRELLINIAKHAGIDRADVEVSADAAHLRVAVRDAGKGFDAAKVLAGPTKGLGLLSVRERIEFAGGTAEIRSRPGKGTEAVLAVPLEREARA